MSNFSDATLRRMVNETAEDGFVSVDKAYALLQKLRDKIFPPGGVVNPGSKFFNYRGTKIELGFKIRGSRVVFDEMAIVEGTVTSIDPYVSNGQLSALFDVTTQEGYTDWVGLESLVNIQDAKGNTLWQEACVFCRKPAKYRSGNFSPVCEYHV